MSILRKTDLLVFYQSVFLFFSIFNLYFIYIIYKNMAGRTNKQGIAKKKALQAKQASRLRGAKRFDYPKRNLELQFAMEQGIVHEVKNPKGSTYHWYVRGRKICWETKLRTDPDGYRYIRTPSGGMNVVQAPYSGYIRRKLSKARR